MLGLCACVLLIQPSSLQTEGEANLSRSEVRLYLGGGGIQFTNLQGRASPRPPSHTRWRVVSYDNESETRRIRVVSEDGKRVLWVSSTFNRHFDNSISTMFPPLEFGTLQKQIETDWVGKKVWVFGGTLHGRNNKAAIQGLDGGVIFEFADDPVQIERIDVLRGPLPVYYSNNNQSLWGLDGAPFGKHSNPVVLTLKPTAPAIVVNPGYSNTMRTHGKRVEEVARTHYFDFEFWFIVHDISAMDRYFSLVPPWEDLGISKSAFKTAMKTREFKKGDSKLLTAWKMRFPAMPGNRAELLAKDLWIYENVPPPGDVTFVNGRLRDWKFGKLP